MVFVNKSIEYTYQDAMGGSSLALMSSGDACVCFWPPVTNGLL